MVVGEEVLPPSTVVEAAWGEKSRLGLSVSTRVLIIRKQEIADLGIVKKYVCLGLDVSDMLIELLMFVRLRKYIGFLVFVGSDKYNIQLHFETPK